MRSQQKHGHPIQSLNMSAFMILYHVGCIINYFGKATLM